MKKLLTIGLTLAFALGAIGFVLAQGDENSGKTYYDDAKTKPKEIFMYKQVVMFDPNNPNNSQTGKQKHGPYFYYYENGKLKVSGEYKNDQKNGTWKYYDDKGKLINTEQYANGELVK